MITNPDNQENGGSTERRPKSNAGLLPLSDGTDTLKALKEAGVRVVEPKPDSERTKLWRGSFSPRGRF